ncbi:MAG: thymidine phosphorylase [Clostridia bacterium]|nr:thymidine phosphorylase [Clostridia bacterium]MDD4376144.1 thymidine phosphorylase [Clostridia bacterium]
MELRCLKCLVEDYGYTGGTADKLASIEGYNLGQGLVDSLRILNNVGACMITQTTDLAAADKKIYALRDVTGTVPSVSLIASSIMSKKIASGVDKIVLEVMCGSGAFSKNENFARELSEKMLAIGKEAGKGCVAIITNMDQPLGRKVGNALEVEEAMEFLLADRELLNSGTYADLKEITYELVAHMIRLAGKGNDTYENKKRIEEVILNGKAYSKFLEIVKAQGGHTRGVYMEHLGKSIDVPVLKNNAKYMKEIKADKEGYLKYVNTEEIGNALVELGGGRNKKEDEIDLSVGFILKKKTGDKVKQGETIMQMIFNDKDKVEKTTKCISKALKINAEKELEKPHVIDIIE